MRKALARLLSSPAALRVLRNINPPPTCHSRFRCLSTAPPPPVSNSGGSPRWIRRIRSNRTSSDALYAQALAQIPSNIDQESNVNDADLHDARVLQIDLVPDDEVDKSRLWALLLEYRERVYGEQGVADIWHGMARREYEMPWDENDNVKYGWKSFIRCRRLAEPLLDRIVHISECDETAHKQFYELWMLHWLPRDPDLALEFHHAFIAKLPQKPLPLSNIVKELRLPEIHNHEILMDIYQSSNENDLYDHVVPVLLESGLLALALEWHAICLRRQDLPSPSTRSLRGVQSLFARSNTGSLNCPPSGLETIQGSAQPMPLITSNEGLSGAHTYNQALLRRLRRRDIEPVRFDDDFCARLFATRSFPPSSIIKGLAMVGIGEIGPRALRVLASRIEPLTELTNTFRELREAGIAIQGTVFSLALERFAVEHNWPVVRSMLDTDQHPDVFEDFSMQQKLLHFYLEQCEWAQVHRTLAILSLFHNDSDVESWNILLRTRIQQREVTHVSSIVQEMRKSEIMLSQESVVAIKSLLRRRQRGHIPVTQRTRFDDLRFVTKMFMGILQGGIGYVDPTCWREILRRYGMLGRLRELRRLVLWLLSWYAPRHEARFANLPRPLWLDSATHKVRRRFPLEHVYFNLPQRMAPTHPRHPVRSLYPQKFLDGLIVWGFRAAWLPHAPHEQSLFSDIASKTRYRNRFREMGILSRANWSIGLRLVVQLRDAGVTVHKDAVIKTVLSEFLLLFGRSSSRKIENRMVSKTNAISYFEYACMVNKIWGEELFPEIHPTLERPVHDMLRHFQHQRRFQFQKSSQRHVSRSRDSPKSMEHRHHDPFSFLDDRSDVKPACVPAKTPTPAAPTSQEERPHPQTGLSRAAEHEEQEQETPQHLEPQHETQDHMHIYTALKSVEIGRNHRHARSSAPGARSGTEK
ncbi:hypothetical protein EJ04DRAFT_517248 [Polyplosphaeria fusca]|uniref:Pentatricopeptide repeat domain-containing protein n=1 Tax=Polyplosphaeria fusca TaxID=682080 RepID=A0A9P4QMA8_9PLEO|nr:hypothetical protein EJ04DRAFT_517248 [Polyplosphaeria fusca]